MTRKFYVGLLGLLLLALCGLAFSQTATTGQIAGTVMDPTGAVVSGAKIILTSDAGLKRELTSDGTGHYSFPLLPPGVYTLEVSASGFASAKVQRIDVRITTTSAVDIPLKIAAAATESIEVTAQPPLVNSESAAAGRVIEQTTIRQLPLPTRNFQQLLTLTPGATGSLQNSSELGRGDAVVSVNGNRSTSNSVVINGIDASAIGTGGTPNLAVPATDTLQEFIVQTSLYDATSGRSTGGLIAAVTKSGTNRFHGNVYEFFRNDVLNANNFFLKRQGTKKPLYERNQFGGTFGGPIVKDKFWFFSSYQGTRETNGSSLLNSLSTIAVPKNLTSDRSAAALKSLYTGLGIAPYFTYLDPLAQRVMNAKLPDGSYLVPNGVPSNCASASDAICPVTIPTISKFQEDQFNANLDYKLTSNNTLNGKFFWANNPTTQGLYSFAGSGNALQAPGAPTKVDLRNRVLSIGDTQIISPRMINDFKFGLNFITVDSLPTEPFKSTCNNDPSEWCVTNTLSSMFSGAPTISIFNNADFNSSPLAANFSQNKTYTFSDMVTWTHGRHAMKFGGEFKLQQVNLRFDAYTRGQLYYLPLVYSGALAVYSLPNSWASFLAGVPTASIIGSGDPYRDIRANDFSFFFQDDWRVNKRLTINVGMRWDAYGPFKEEKGRFVALDPSRITTSPISFTGGSGVALTAGLVQAGNGSLPNVPKVSDGLIDRDLNNFGPRIGFAFKPLDSDKVVMRGGYGIYYDRMNSRLFNSQVFNAPYYSVAINVVGTGGLYINPSDPYYHVPTPDQFPGAFPSFPTSMTKNGFLALPYIVNATFPGTVSYPVPATGVYPDLHNFRTPLIQQYNFGIQAEIINNMLLDVSYVGSNGQTLTRQRNLNQATLPGSTAGPLSPAVSVLATAPLGTFMIQTSARSSYNSLQTSLTKRYSNGLQFIASYTWSHSIDDYSGGDVNDLVALPGDTTKNYFASSDFDRRHRFIVSYIYDLPKFYKGGNGAAKRIVNGWEIAGITTAQTGTPFGIYDASFFKNVWGDLASGRTLQSAEKSGDVIQRLNGYFDKTAFVTPTGVGNFGGVPRNYFRGPGQVNFDFSVVKFIPITESQKFEFRTELFNIFNHTNFANPVNLVSSPTFGQILRTSTGPRVIQFGMKYSF